MGSLKFRFCYFAPNHILWVLNGITSEYLQIMFGCIINKSYPITRHTRYCTFVLTLSKVKKNCALCEETRAAFKSTSYLQMFCHWSLLLLASSLGTDIQGKMFTGVLHLWMQPSIHLWQPVHQFSQVTFIWNTLSCSPEVSKVYVQCSCFNFVLPGKYSQSKLIFQNITRDKLSDRLVQISFECKSNNPNDYNKVSW